MKKTVPAICALLCCLGFSGCLGPVQADEYNYVVAVGFDSGNQFEYRISMLLQTEKSSDSQTATGGGEVVSAEGDTLFDAVETIHAGGPYRLNFSRVNTVVMNEELARRGDFQKLEDIAINSIKLRRSVKLITSTCEAGSFLQGLCRPSSQNMTKLLFDVYSNYSVDGITAITNYSLLVEGIKSGRSDCVMMLGGLDASAGQQENAKRDDENENTGTDSAEKGRGNGENEPQYTTDGVLRTGGLGSFVSGTALFDGWYMKGVLNGEDTKYLLIGTGGLDTCSISFDYENENVVLQLRDMQRAKVSFTAEEKPTARTELVLYCSILQLGGDMKGDKWKNGLKAAAEKYIEEEIRRVFDICRGLNCDAFAFGRQAAMQFSNTTDWENYDWKRRYPGLEADFSVELKLADEHMAAMQE